MKTFLRQVELKLKELSHVFILIEFQTFRERRAGLQRERRGRRRVKRSR